MIRWITTLPTVIDFYELFDWLLIAIGLLVVIHFMWALLCSTDCTKNDVKDTNRNTGIS